MLPTCQEGERGTKWSDTSVGDRYNSQPSLVTRSVSYMGHTGEVSFAYCQLSDVGAGQAGKSIHQTVEVYNSTRDSWQLLPGQMLTERKYLAAACLGGMLAL